MRNVVVAVSIFAIALAVWLANRKPAFDSPPRDREATASDASPPHNRSVVPTESAAAIADSEEQIATGIPQPAGSEPAPATTPAIVLQMVDQRALRVLPSVRENEKAFVIEPLDPLWSRTREAEILGQLAQVGGARLSTVEVECRTSMCRLQFTQNVANGSDEHRGVPSPFYAELLARLGYEQMIRPVMARDNAGTVASLAYLPRQHE
jgi:hypothetical protein